MRKLVLALVLVLAISGFAMAAHIDPALVDMMNGTKVVKDGMGLNGKPAMIPVIVQMNPGAGNTDVQTLGGQMGSELQIINGFSASLPAAAIEALSKNPNVFAISYDKPVKIDMNVAAKAVFCDELWAEGYTGDGVTIAVVDTGIYPHQDFGTRIKAFKDFVNGRTSAYDDNGHGTHCAGIAAGAGATYKGAAPDAKLVGVKVLDAQGSGSYANIINGINWVVNNRATYGIKIMSMSLGGTITESSKTDPMCAAVRNAWNAGIVVCVAAGNEGPSSYTIGTPGNEPLIITVGASDDRSTIAYSDDIVASFSSRGPTSIDGWTKPDLLAPGTNITSCKNAYTGYVTMSGTSMATPLVAGIVAQMLEANPTWTPATVKTNLKGSCINLGYTANVQGSGQVDAYYAVH